jgi:hypothetical protein
VAHGAEVRVSYDTRRTHLHAIAEGFCEAVGLAVPSAWPLGLPPCLHRLHRLLQPLHRRVARRAGVERAPFRPRQRGHPDQVPGRL